jgi:excisionase family DNA binding protein
MRTVLKVSIDASPVRLPLPEDKPLLTLLEAARPLGVGRSTAYAMARAQTFPVEVLTIGGRYWVRNAELREYLGLAAA